MPETQRQRLVFHSERHLRAWLRGHPDGKALLAREVDDAVEAKCRECSKPIQSALLVADGCGSVELYSNSYVRVRIVERPYVCDPGSELWPEARRLGDEYLRLTLPWVYRDMLLPGYLRADVFVRQVTPEMIEERDWMLTILKGLRQK